MNDNLQVIETNNQRVLTTAQIAEQYETNTDAIQRNFQRNKERYTEGKHYYCLTGAELKEFKDWATSCRAVNPDGSELIDKRAAVLYLWTEKGALMLAKSLNTDKAWEAYEVLVDTYFSVHGLPQRDSYMIEDPVLRAQRWIEEQKEKQQLLTTVAVQNQQIAELQPKASYYDVVLNCKVRLIAQCHQIAAQRNIGGLHVDADASGLQRRTAGVILHRVIAKNREVCHIAARLHAILHGLNQTNGCFLCQSATICRNLQ